MSVLLSYSVVNEPTAVERAARLPDPSVRVKQNVSDDANPFRLTRTALTHSLSGIEKIELLDAAGVADSTARPPPRQLRAGNGHNFDPRTLIPTLAPTVF